MSNKFIKESINQPFVSIIILNYNGIGDIEECLKSLSNLDYDNLEIIIIDNNMGDDSVNFVRRNYKNLKIIKLKKNYGFVEGKSRALSYIKGR